MKLTERQREVLWYVALGKTNNELGMILAISPKTAKNHVVKLVTKLSASNRTGLVWAALQQGLIDPPEVVRQEAKVIEPIEKEEPIVIEKAPRKPEIIREILEQNIGRVVSIGRLCEALYQGRLKEMAVRAHICRLRKTLASKHRIVTERELGYRMLRSA